MAAITRADFNGDGRTDIAATGVFGWGSLPVAFSNGNGTFNVANLAIPGFASYVTQPGAQVVYGDFNGDGRTDVAATGGYGWGSIPVAFSNGNGSFTVTNVGVSGFPGYVTQPGAHVVVGDFNGDGRTDIAATGGYGWGSIPVAFSNGNGTFSVTNIGVPGFPGYVTQPGAQVVVGDFNGDGRTDIAATGGYGWGSIPVAFSNGNGSFTVTNVGVPGFPSFVTQPNVKVFVGDFNGDGRADLAATGGVGWGSIPVAFSNGNGTFNATNLGVPGFPSYVTQPGAKVVVGDFNGDGRADLAATGGFGWSSIPIAFSTGNGTFTVTNLSVPGFPFWVTPPGAKVIVGDFNGDHRTDIAASGGFGWGSIPVAFSLGNGAFSVTNSGVAGFPTWASQPGVKLIPNPA